MLSNTVIPWERYALISELALRYERNNKVQFGKTVLQKVIFILQEIYKIPLGYDFSLYTYGPYTSEVFQDLDAVESLEGVQVRSIETGYGGYEIIPGSGKGNTIIRSKGKAYLESDPLKTTLDSLIKDFGGFTARDLELRATLIFIDRDLKGTSQHTMDNLAALLHEIKPKFPLHEIKQVIEEMKENGFVLSQ